MPGRKVARKTVGESAAETVQNGALSGGEEWRDLVYGSVGAHCRKRQGWRRSRTSCSSAGEP